MFLRFQGQGDVDQCKDYLDVAWNRLAASDWSLMVKNASMEDSGMYECQVNLVLISDCHQYIIRFLILHWNFWPKTSSWPMKWQWSNINQIIGEHRSKNEPEIPFDGQRYPPSTIVLTRSKIWMELKIANVTILCWNCASKERLREIDWWLTTIYYQRKQERL